LTNIVELNRKFNEIAERAEKCDHLSPDSEVRFAKISAGFGEVNQIMQVLDENSNIEPIKSSEIVLFQERLQVLLTDINDNLNELNKNLPK
jgi:hypothetical protein